MSARARGDMRRERRRRDFSTGLIRPKKRGERNQKFRGPSLLLGEGEDEEFFFVEAEGVELADFLDTAEGVEGIEVLGVAGGELGGLHVAAPEVRVAVGGG